MSMEKTEMGENEVSLKMIVANFYVFRYIFP